jgi:DnaK suppressor protein
MAMKTAVAKMDGAQEILERTAAELAQVLRSRDGIAIEKSADQMDEVQYALERELAIRNADRTFGVCVECEYEISPKRLLAVPWASRCIECQDAADRDQQENSQSFSETIADAA